MKRRDAFKRIDGVIGTCGAFETFLGFASARVLCACSFAEILDEDTGIGYQRPPNRQHSRDFRQYITSRNTSTIPLTFNLRRDRKSAWRLTRKGAELATLELDPNVPCLAQVDCQHRLGDLQDVDVSLAFMSFIGLDLRTEMAIFFIINSKARGLSTSLTDYHQSNLLADLASEAPHLYIARRLNEDPTSPWFRLIRYGGQPTSGLKRRTSLRMMQRSLDRLLRQVKGLPLGSADQKYSTVLSYWRAVQSVFSEEWSDHRHHLLTKGVGLYSLTLLLADLLLTADPLSLSEDYFVRRLRPLKGVIDWRSDGMFANAGGQKGAADVYAKLRAWAKP